MTKPSSSSDGGPISEGGEVAMKDMVETAVMIAAKAHAGVRDKNGEPYVLHPIRVMLAVKVHGEAVMAAAVLHDVVEDTGVTMLALAWRGFPEEVLNAVDAVSKRDGETYLIDFIPRANEDPLGRHVKIADILDNLREPFPFGDGMRNRYLTALAILGAPGYGGEG